MIRFLPLVCCLAACSGGGGGSATNPAPGDAFLALQDRVTMPGVTPFVTLPETGTADYRGQVRLNLPFGAAPAAFYHGDLDLRVSFGAASELMTGSITRLTGPGAAVTGVLAIGDGAFFPDASPVRDYQFTADLGGSLTQNGQVHDITAEMSGDFYGSSGAGIAGVIYQGVIRQGDDIDVFDGAFAAEAVSGR